MPRRPPPNAEQILLSPEDADLAERFLFRRSFNKDGTLRYAQVIGVTEELTAAAEQRAVDPQKLITTEQSAMSLPRLVAQRMLGRPLKGNEVVQPKNGKSGDNRRSNLEITTRSVLSSHERAGRAESGSKYVYATEAGRYYVNFKNTYLGTYDNIDAAEQAVTGYQALLDQGIPERQAAQKIKMRARNTPKIIIQE